jgi:hypothetical protein
MLKVIALSLFSQPLFASVMETTPGSFARFCNAEAGMEQWLALTKGKLHSLRAGRRLRGNVERRLVEG